MLDTLLDVWNIYVQNKKKQKAEGAYICTNSGVKETSNFLFSEHGRQRNSEDKFPLASIVKYDPFSKTGKLHFYFLSRGAYFWYCF